jgi:hypothetical protein
LLTWGAQGLALAVSVTVKADNELRAAQKLNEASDQGDAKASLAILATRSRLDGPAGDQCGRLSEDQRHHGA